MFKFLLSFFATLVALQASLGHPADVSENIEDLFKTYSPILPLIDDPLIIADGEFSLDPFAPLASGSVSLCSGVVTGLSTLNISVGTAPGGIGGIDIILSVKLPTVQIKGFYTSDIVLALKDLIPIIAEDLNVVGQGELLAGLTGGNVAVVVRINIATVTIRTLNIDIGFESAGANLEDLSVNGEPIIWEDLNQAIKPIFDRVWGGIKDNVTAAIKDIADEVIKDCTLPDIIGIIVGNGTAECLNIPTIPGMPRPMSLLRSIIKPSVACQVLVPTTEYDVSDEPTEPADVETSTIDGEEPVDTPSTVPTNPPTTTPSSSVVLQPFYQIMYLFLLIAAVDVRLFPTF